MASRILEGKNANHRIFFGVNAVANLTKELRKPLEELGSGDSPLEDLRVMMMVGLRFGEGDKKITLDNAGDIMDDIIAKNGFEYLSNELSKAINDTFGNKSEEMESEEKTEAGN